MTETLRLSIGHKFGRWVLVLILQSPLPFQAGKLATCTNDFTLTIYVCIRAYLVPPINYIDLTAN